MISCMEWYGMVWYGMAWYGMIWYSQHTAAQLGIIHCSLFLSRMIKVCFDTYKMRFLKFLKIEHNKNGTVTCAFVVHSIILPYFQFSHAIYSIQFSLIIDKITNKKNHVLMVQERLQINKFSTQIITFKNINEIGTKSILKLQKFHFSLDFKQLLNLNGSTQNHLSQILINLYHMSYLMYMYI